MDKKIFSALAVVIILVVVGGVFYFNARPESEKMMHEGEEMMEEGEKMMKEGEEMMGEGEAMMKDGEAMMEKDGEAMMSEEGESMVMKDSYEGQLLAGDKSPLLDFVSSDYERAIASDKVVVLYFYASWCPICRAEFPKMQSAFDKLGADNVIGFRVNFNDSDTEDAERALASEFGVAYQHTKVILKNGERLLKSPESWGEDRFLSEIEGVLVN